VVGHSLGGLVARVTQPYRVAGARAPGSAVRQDAAWIQIVTALRRLAPDVPLVQGGRSNGARVACRTAAVVGARAVIAGLWDIDDSTSAALTGSLYETMESGASPEDALRRAKLKLIRSPGTRPICAAPSSVPLSTRALISFSSASVASGRAPTRLGCRPRPTAARRHCQITTMAQQPGSATRLADCATNPRCASSPNPDTTPTP